MKQFDVKDIKSWANCCDVKIGDEGYFADCLDVIKDRTNRGELYKIIKITPDSSSCFTAELGIANYSYGFFLPADKVREEKKKYRPIRTVEDLCKLLGKNKCINPVLSSVTIRNKTNKNVRYNFSINGFSITEDTYEIYEIWLGSFHYSTTEMFNKYEILINGEWLPFGVEE